MDFLCEQQSDLLPREATVSSPYSIPFTELLLRESARAERYNHFFSVLVIQTDDMDVTEAMRRTRDRLRACDMAGILDEDGICHRLPLQGRNSDQLPDAVPRGANLPLVVVLPETGRDGAEIVEKRIQKRLMDDGNTRVGIAIYPDDSTRPENLLDIAREGNGKRNADRGYA